MTQAHHDSPRVVDLGDGLHLDLDKAQHVLVQGSSRAGKSNLLRRIVEHAADMGFQIIVVDPEGEYATLREAVPDLIIAGGLDADVPLTPENAYTLTTQLYKHRSHAVFDVSEHEPDRDAPLIVAEIHRAINAAPRPEWHDVLIVDDELQRFSAKDKSLETREMVKARKAISLTASAGLKRGHHLLAGTQRVAALDNSVVGLCNAKLIGRSDADTDAERTVKQLGLRGPEKDAAIQSLDELLSGQFYARGIAFNHKGARLVKTSRAKTEPPGRGAGRRSVPKPRGAVLEVLAKLATDPQPSERPTGAPAAAAAPDMERIQQELHGVKTELARANREANELSAWVARAEARSEHYRRALQAALETLTGALSVDPAPAQALDEPPRAAPRATFVSTDAKIDLALHDGFIPTVYDARASPAPGRGATPGGPLQPVLDAAAGLHAAGFVTLPLTQLAAWVGIAARTARDRVQALVRDGLMERQGPGEVRLTPAGHAASDPPDVSKYASLRSALARGPLAEAELLVLDILHAAPGAVPARELEHALGLQARTVRDRVQKLVRLGLARRTPGGVEAAAWLPERHAARTTRATKARPSPPPPPAAPPAPDLPAGANRMLDALRAYHPLPLRRDQLSHLARVRGGALQTYIRVLRDADLVRADETGFHLTPRAAPAPHRHTRVTITAIWHPHLAAGAHRILDIVTQRGAAGIPRDELSAAAEVRGGAFTSYLHDLRLAGLITSTRGTIYPADPTREAA